MFLFGPVIALKGTEEYLKATMKRKCEKEVSPVGFSHINSPFCRDLGLASRLTGSDKQALRDSTVIVNYCNITIMSY